jgi:hypothetical protein
LAHWRGGLTLNSIGADVARETQLLRRIRVNPWPVFALLAVVLGGCSGSSLEGFAFGKQPQTTSASDPNIYPSHYREQIAEFMRTYLNNPTKVKDASITEPVLRQVAGTPHYVSCVRYNPRDINNRYEGPQTRQATFLGGNLIQFLTPEGDACNGLAYQRFPAIESMVP